MNRFKDGIKLGLWFVFILSVFMIICGTWYWLLKAERANTKSTTDASPAWVLYSTAWTTLTAQKWNELVDRTKVNYLNQAFTNWDVTLTTSYQNISTFTMTTWNSPVLLSMNGFISSSTTSSVNYCWIRVDWVVQKGWYYYDSVTAGNPRALNFSVITDVLTAWSHTFLFKCKASVNWAVLYRSSTYGSFNMSAVELKQ